MRQGPPPPRHVAASRQEASSLHRLRTGSVRLLREGLPPERMPGRGLRTLCTATPQIPVRGDEFRECVPALRLGKALWLDNLANRRVKVRPAIARAHHAFEILLQCDRILHRILYDSTYKIWREALGRHFPVAEVRRRCPGAHPHRNRLCSRERA